MNIALVIIDMQNDFVLPEAPLCVKGAQATVPTIQKLLDRARAEGWRVLADGAGDAEAAVRLYLLAARGGDVRQSPDWPALSEMPSTTGHYFRGVE